MPEMTVTTILVTIYAMIAIAVFVIGIIVSPHKNKLITIGMSMLIALLWPIIILVAYDDNRL